MRIPPYWTKGHYSAEDVHGKKQSFSAWGWSFDSRAAAAQDGAARARRIYDYVVNRQKPESYDYQEHPLREEIVESIDHGSNQTAMITRNRYGALILNCASVCFVDIDFPVPKPVGLWTMICRVFSSEKNDTRRQDGRDATIKEVTDWSGQNPDRSFRLYQTAAGLRLLFTDRTYDPVSSEVSDLFNVLGSDTLYKKLTHNQACFRARLTPKPWRCGCQRPPSEYPRESTEKEQSYTRWLQAYESKSKAFGICRLIQTFGTDAQDEVICDVIARHDEYACCNTGRPLA
jgi:hypothetical protein